jgi:hypothetical protein
MAWRLADHEHPNLVLALVHRLMPLPGPDFDAIARLQSVFVIFNLDRQFSL